MKKILVALSVAAAATTSSAQHRNYTDIIVPMFIGGLVVQAINQANQANRRDDPPVVIYQSPQIIYQTPRVYQLNRAPEPVYEKRMQYDPVCGCQTEILVQIGWR